MIDWGKVDRLQLHPGFLADVEAMLTPSPVKWLVTSGYRSLAIQKVLYAKYLAGGPRAAPAGMSAHNFGLAIDVAPVSSGGEIVWTVKAGDDWHWLKAQCDPHPRLRHGSHFGDWPHIEKVHWMQYKGWLVPPPSLTA